MAFISMHGMLDLKVVSGNVDGDIYSDFVEKVLLHHLIPFDGNNPYSVVILDNCIVHHCPHAVQLIQVGRAIVHFLPLYSADYNAIEEVFSKVKAEMETGKAG